MVKLLLFLVCVLCSFLVQGSERPPNIVLIFADDLGYGDLGCYGATKVKTPHIDRLAAEGRRFTDAHSASAVCTPSRYALLTGQYPLRANCGKGVWGPSPITSGLIIDTDEVTIADVLKKKNYATAAMGKWHLGFGREKNDWKQPLRPGPNDLGFDYYYGLPVVNSAPPYVYVENDRVVGGDPDDPLIYVGRNGSKQATPITPIPPEASQRSANQFTGAAKAHKIYNDYTVGTVLAGKAVDWISDNKEKPFFLYLATTHIHHPFTPGKRFQGSSDAELYGDFIQELDWMVGQVTDSLEKHGLSDDTLVIFTSDNGGMMNLGGRNAVKAGHKINGDLLGFKFGSWEGGHRVPFIAKWPGRIKPGTVSDQLICNVDMLASFMALTGQDVGTLDGKDSINILPALVGEPSEPLRDELLLAAHKPSHLALRKGKWIYIGAKGSGGFGGSKPGQHAWGGPAAVQLVGGVNSDIVEGRFKKGAPNAQLYDLEADINQARNVVKDHPDVVKELSGLLDTYMPQRSKPAPRKKNTTPPGKPARKKPAGKSSRGASFGFESGKLAPWKVIEGRFRHIIGSRERFFRDLGDYNKQGKYYLTTLESAPNAARGDDKQTGVIVSPLFVAGKGTMTFRVGGGSGQRTYIALCSADGKELKKAHGINNQTMQEAEWDLRPYAGKKLFLKVVDQSETGWGHITADDFEFDGKVLKDYPKLSAKLMK